MAVVDLGVGLHDIAAAIVAAVADGDLECPDLRLGALLGDPGGERPGLRQHLDGRERVAEPAEAALQAGLQPLREIGTQADAGDVEEGVAVDRSEIDAARMALDDDVGGLHEVHRNAERARQVVGGAHRDDAERQAAFHDGHRAGCDRCRRRRTG